jgi:hypothetical protein
MGFITEGEAWKVIDSAAAFAWQNLSNWNDYVNSYVIGRTMWGGASAYNGTIIDIAAYSLTEAKSPWGRCPGRKPTVPLPACRLYRRGLPRSGGGKKRRVYGGARPWGPAFLPAEHADRGFPRIRRHNHSRHDLYPRQKVAGRLAGSEAIVSARWKMSYASYRWDSSLNGFARAAEQGLFSENFFEHLERARLRLAPQVAVDFAALGRDAEGRPRYFALEPSLKEQCFASHPGAKNPFVPGVVDPRSPWMLFGQKPECQKPWRRFCIGSI